MLSLSLYSVLEQNSSVTSFVTATFSEEFTLPAAFSTSTGSETLSTFACDFSAIYKLSTFTNYVSYSGCLSFVHTSLPFTFDLFYDRTLFQVLFCAQYFLEMTVMGRRLLYIFIREQIKKYRLVPFLLMDLPSSSFFPGGMGKLNGIILKLF